MAAVRSMDGREKGKSRELHAVVPGGDTLAHPRRQLRWWEVARSQTRLKDLTHRTADGFEMGYG